MDSSRDIKQETDIEPIEALEDGNHKLHPFVCGLCNCSYGQFASFYKHFKKHSKEVGQDSFHICEDLPSSERDVCDDQSGSLEMQTFNCGICPASFITVCLLHEHMKKHESKVSYTLDMQSNTGYPSSKQSPCVSLGIVKSSTLPMREGSLSKSGVKSKRGRPTKRGPPDHTVNMPDSEIRKKRGRPLNYVPPPEIGKRNRKGRSSLHEPPQGTTVASEAQVKTRRGRSSRHGVVGDGASTPDKVKKLKKGTCTCISERHESSKDITSAQDPQGKSRKGRQISCKQLNKHSESSKMKPSKSIGLKVGRVKRPESVWSKVLDRSEKGKKGHKGKHVSVKSESDETLSKDSSEKIGDERQDNVKSNIAAAEQESNEHDSNMENEEDAGVDTYNDDDDDDGDNNDADNEALFNDDSDDDWEAAISGYIDTIESKPLATSREDKTVAKSADSLASGSGDKPQDDTADEKGQTAYNFRRKQTSSRQAKPSAKKKGTVKKKYLFCEVCGIKRGKNLLVKHVEEKHKDVVLSKEFLDILGKLKGTKPRKNKGVYIKKVKDEKVEDKDFVPKFSELPRPGKIKHVKVLRYGKVENYAECRRCGMITQLGLKLARHRKNHQKNPDKFHPDNLTRCKECERVMFKVDSFKHKCYLKIIREEGEKAKGEGDRKEEEPAVGQRKKYKRYDKLIPCHLCGHLVNRYTLKVHILSHSEDRPFKCSHCSKTFKMEKNLKLHERSNHGERTFQCDQCAKAFYTMHQLKYHLVNHSDDRPFSCTKCEKVFSRRDQLRNHMKMHSAVKRHICQDCGKAFSRLINMQSHMSAVHRDERYWVCSWPHCAKRFNTGPLLRRHMITHTGYKPEKCTHCDMAFSQRPELKTHLMRRHNIDKMPPPSHDNPYAGVKHQVIGEPVADGDPDKPGTSARNFKTISFSSALSMVDLHALQQQLATQTNTPTPRKHKPKSGRSGERAASSVHRSLDVKAGLSYSVSDANTKPSTSAGNIEDEKVCMDVAGDQETSHKPLSSSGQSKQGTNATNTTSDVLQATASLPLFNNAGSEMSIGVMNFPNMLGTNDMFIYSNTKAAELRTSKTDTAVMPASVLPGTSRFPMYTDNKCAPGTDVQDTGLGQGPSSLSVLPPGVKSELASGSVDLQNFMPAAMPYQASGFSHKPI